MKYPVVEVFQSIQGEGLFVGAPVNFIRLAGCNLSCHFCDTSKDAQMELTAKEIMDKLNYDVKLAVITGGEPTTHNLTELIKALRESFYKVHLETNGTKVPPSGVDWTSVSPKKEQPPVSNFLFSEAKWLIPEWKPEEIDWALAKQHWLQPVNEVLHINTDNLKLCLEYLEDINPPRSLRLSVQLHKLIGAR